MRPPAPTLALPSIFDRRMLFADLGHAVEAGSPPSVLVLFGFEGLKEHLATVTPDEGVKLLARLGKRLQEAFGRSGDLYAPRRGEFCGLFDGGLGAVRSLLVSVPVELDAEIRPLPIRTSLGIASLPEEAAEQTYALSLADRRLRALSGELRLPPECLTQDA
jgi:hypothetical protein